MTTANDSYWTDSKPHAESCHRHEYDPVSGTWRYIHASTCEAHFIR